MAASITAILFVSDVRQGEPRRGELAGCWCGDRCQEPGLVRRELGHVGHWIAGGCLETGWKPARLAQRAAAHGLLQ